MKIAKAPIFIPKFMPQAAEWRLLYGIHAGYQAQDQECQ